MIKPLLKYSGILFTFLLLVASLQYFLLLYFYSDPFENDVIPKVYGLWLLLSILGFSPVFWLRKKKSKKEEQDPGAECAQLSRAPLQ